MKYQMFKEQVIDNLESYKENILLCKENGTYQGVEYKHILPENKRFLNLLPTVKNPGRGFKKHIYAHHLNSSQMMCYNFFKPLVEMKDGREILLKLIGQTAKIPISIDSVIVNDEENGEFFFESPGRDTEEKVNDEGTKFDFYLRLSTGEKFYFEVKYIEQGFDKINNSSINKEEYVEKWNKVYKNHLTNSLFLKDMTKEDFFNNYQLNRIVSYMRSEKDYVILIFCYDNEIVKWEAESLITVMNDKGCRNIIPIDWKEICNAAIEICKDTRYYKHFIEFEEKYLLY